MTTLVQIFMPLLGEGTNCWRPVSAEPLGDGLFQICSLPNSDEEWEFPTGSRVICEPRSFSNGESGLVAVRLIQDAQ